MTQGQTHDSMSKATVIFLQRAHVLQTVFILCSREDPNFSAQVETNPVLKILAVLLVHKYVSINPQREPNSPTFSAFPCYFRKTSELVQWTFCE